MPFDVQAALVALRFDSADPIWPNRDRFVLSNGHASMLLYAILHLSGVKAVNAKYERLGQEQSHSRTSNDFGSSGANVPVTRNIT